MTLTMTKKGHRNDFILKGTCRDCGAEFEADPSDGQGQRNDQNCNFCNGIRSVRMQPAPKKELLCETSKSDSFYGGYLFD